MRRVHLETSVAGLLKRSGATIAIAESCTGGLLCSRITAVSGCSSYFVGGLVAYADRVKVRQLGLDRASLRRHGAVCREVAQEMATQARRRLGADFGIGITGIAGPTGGSVGKPVGTVYVAVAAQARCVVRGYRFRGGRKAVRNSSCKAALRMLWDVLIESNGNKRRKE